MDSKNVRAASLTGGRGFGEKNHINAAKVTNKLKSCNSV